MADRSKLLPSVLLGIGLGGFIDGIVLHQILQWHHMVTSQACCPADTVSGLERNTLGDGIFHAGTWVVTVIGMLATVRAWRAGDLAPPWVAHWGGLIMGWGIFNAADTGNHILGVHHIRDDLGGPIGWDIGFAVFAVILIAIGWAMVRAGAERTESTRPAAPV